MIDTTALSTLTIVPLRAVNLNDRTRQWVRDLELKGQNLGYLRDADFELGYHFGYQIGQEELADGDIPTLESVIDEIERSLSHTLYDQHRCFAGVCADDPSYPSYAYQVGALFGWLTALLQTDTALDFRFLLAPVTDMHSYYASRLPRVSDGWPLDS